MQQQPGKMAFLRLSGYESRIEGVTSNAEVNLVCLVICARLVDYDEQVGFDLLVSIDGLEMDSPQHHG